MMDEFKRGWYTELCPLWPGRALSMRVEESLCERQSRFQKIEIFKAEGFGLTMALDGKIQCAASDEFMYHEMLVHLPAFAHPRPERALVIGGGDGGAARELARHESLEIIDVCELDPEVVEAAKERLPAMACGFDDPRVGLHFADGSEFVRSKRGFYDLIIVDAPDPVGPGEALFAKSFFEDVKAALRPGGAVSAQSESFMLHPDYSRRQAEIFSELFKSWGYSFFAVPSYPGGTLGVCVGSDAADVKTPCRTPQPPMADSLRCYSPEMHKASFAAPAFWSRELREMENRKAQGASPCA